MSPIRTFSNWNSRTSDSKPQIAPYRKYFFICEGSNTERWYFTYLINRRKSLNLHPLIDITYVKNETTSSSPISLLKKADKLKKDRSFNEKDKIIIVFDYDIYQHKNNKRFDKVIKRQGEYELAITNPKFELFLLLHYENSYDKKLKSHHKEVLSRERVKGNKTYLDEALASYTPINPKKNENIGKLAKRIHIAIQQEKKLNQDINKCENNVTCNIGKIIEMIKKDRGNTL